jgi:hypothetical protein
MFVQRSNLGLFLWTIQKFAWSNRVKPRKPCEDNWCSVEIRKRCPKNGQKVSGSHEFKSIQPTLTWEDDYELWRGKSMTKAFVSNFKILRSRYSDWLRAEQQRGRSSNPSRVKNFHFSISYRPALGPTQPPIQWVPGELSPGVKRQGREADHSPPASAEFKKMWIYRSPPPYAFMA